VLEIGNWGENDIGNSGDIINVDIAGDSGEYPEIRTQIINFVFSI